MLYYNDYKIVPIISWSGDEYYAIKHKKGFLHPTKDGFEIKANPYTFASCKKAMSKLIILTTRST